MIKEEVKKSIEIGGKTLTLSTGKLAKQADAAVLASYGETVVLATVVSSTLTTDLGYFPLTVEYMERLYAGGRIKGSRWVKREGRPSDDEILTDRLIDRSIRPLFPKDYKKEVQVIITVLSVDQENSPDVIAAIATSAALSISEIPWLGPVSVVRISQRNGDFITFPTVSEILESNLELVVTLSKNSVVMIEAGAREVTEEVILDGIAAAQKDGDRIIKLLQELTDEAGVKKDLVQKDSHDVKIKSQIRKMAGDKVTDLIKKTSLKKAGPSDYSELRMAVVSSFPKEEVYHATVAFEDLFREIGREMILGGKRPDSRKTDEIRKLSCEVGVLPRTHGSAIFSRGETQVLTVTTLASHELEQLIETAEGEESKRYMHHYSMPPYSVGETGRIGSPSRREIGHGALVERALEPVIPSEETFPYTIRVVSEVLSSNGSTSMASVCGSSLSLMDAGVPIKGAVSGIAMGLVVENPDKYVILSDITGLEDGIGDMDFKVAGTKDGITALQLDVKTLNLTLPILKVALTQAKTSRKEIMDFMLKTISLPQTKVSRYAPKIKVLKVAQDKIGEVIGPGGRTIRKIIAETGAKVDVEDDGSVHISALSDEALIKAVETIESLTKEIKAGEIYTGIIKRIEPFGVFAEILPSKEGMVHVSDMSENFTNNPSDIVKLGDKVQVRVKEIDNLGRINLSMLMDASHDKPRMRKEMSPRSSSGSSGREDFGRGRFTGRKQFDRKDSGPHFPASRLVGENKRRFGR